MILLFIFLDDIINPNQNNPRASAFFQNLRIMEYSASVLRENTQILWYGVSEEIAELDNKKRGSREINVILKEFTQICAILKRVKQIFAEF